MKLLHLPHVEDMIFDGNFLQSLDSLIAVVDAISGDLDYPKYLSMSTKFDGAPAIVFGVNPENKQFFVGTKSVFNKRIPRIIYSLDDIVTNYSDKSELSNKLTKVFNAMTMAYHQGFIPDGVYQGDLMFTDDDVVYDEKTVSFTPNTIGYHISNTTNMAEEIRRADIGIVVHTKYEGDTLATMSATPRVDHSMFENGRGVFFIDPTVAPINFTFTDTQRRLIINALEYSEAMMKDVDDGFIERHSEHLKKFMNHCVRIGEARPSIGMYRVYLNNRVHELLANDAVDTSSDLTSLFTVHRYLIMVKNIILDVLNMGSVFYHEVDGRPTKGEGYVITYHGVMCKIVDRLEFSRLNFANKKFARAA